MRHGFDVSIEDIMGAECKLATPTAAKLADVINFFIRVLKKSPDYAYTAPKPF